MKKWHADEVGNGIDHEYGVDVYLASDVAELERQLTEQARLNGMGSEREAKLMARVAELEKALTRCVEAIDTCYDDTSEARGMPSELSASAEAARLLMGK